MHWYLQLYDQNFTHVQFLISPVHWVLLVYQKYVSGWHAFIYPRSYQHIAFKTQFKASRVSNLRMINVHNFPHKCSKSCSTLFWDSKSSLWIHLLSVDTSPKCYCLQHEYCIHHPQCHLYLKSLVQKTTTSNAIVLQCSHQDHFKDQLSWFLLLLQTSHDQDHFQHQLSWLLLLPQTSQGCFQLPSHSSAMIDILTCWSCFLLTDVSIGV